MIRKKRSPGERNVTVDDDQDPSEVRVFEYYESHNSSMKAGGPDAIPKLYTDVHRAKLVKQEPRTTVATPINRKRRIRINTRPKKVASETVDLANDTFFFDELSKNKPSTAKPEDVEIYQRPNVDKDIVFVQHDDPKGKKLAPDTNKQKEEEPKQVDYDDGGEAAEEEAAEPEEEAAIDYQQQADETDDETSDEFEELNADFEIVDEDDRGSVEHEIIEYRSPSKVANQKNSGARPKAKGKHYVRQFETQQELYEEIDKIINDKSAHNAQENDNDDDDDNSYWQVRIKKPHVNRGKT